MILRVMGKCLVKGEFKTTEREISVDVLAWVRGGSWSKVLGWWRRIGRVRRSFLHCAKCDPDVL